MIMKTFFLFCDYWKFNNFHPLFRQHLILFISRRDLYPLVDRQYCSYEYDIFTLGNAYCAYLTLERSNNGEVMSSSYRLINTESVASRLTHHITMVFHKYTYCVGVARNDFTWFYQLRFFYFLNHRGCQSVSHIWYFKENKQGNMCLYLIITLCDSL